MVEFSKGQLITNENLSEFADWINNNPKIPASYVRVADDLSFESLSNAVNNTNLLGEMFAVTIQNNNARVSECLEWIDKRAASMPDKADTDFFNGLSRSYYHGYASNMPTAHELVQEKMAERSLKDNIAVWSLPGSPLFSADAINTEQQVSKLNSREANALRFLYEKYKKIQNHQGNSWNTSWKPDRDDEAYDVVEGMKQLLASGVLKNCPQLLPEMRQEVNSHLTITDYKDLEPQFFTRDMVKDLIRNSEQWWQKTNQDTSQAKTQDEKNVNILSPEVRKYKAVIMAELERISKSNKDFRAGSKGLNESFKELYAEIWPESKGNLNYTRHYSPVVNALYLETAQQDIIAGRTDKLDNEEIRLVLEKDKTGFYADKIPEELAGSFVQSQAKSVIRKGKKQNIGNIARSLNDSRVSFADKKILAETAREILDEHKAKKQLYEEKLNAFKQDQQKVSDIYSRANAAESAVSDVEGLARLFRELQSTLSEKKLPAEQHLTPEAVEERIELIAKGRSLGLYKPEWGALPLLIGRKKEEERRNSVEHQIERINDSLSAMFSDEHKAAAVKKYIGSLLYSGTPEALQQDSNTLKEQAEQMKKELQLEARNLEIINLSREINDHSIGELQYAAASVERKVSDLKKRKMKNSAVSEKLEIVPTGNSEEAARAKTEVRKRNKARNLDPLVEKARKKALDNTK